MMLNPRWRKILRDLQQNMSQVVLVVGAIALGIFSVAWVSSSYGILSRELNANYRATHPASAILYMNDIPPDMVVAIQDLAEIDQAEATGIIQGRIWVDDEWRTLEIYVRQDFANTRINQLVAEDGTFLPPQGEIVLERMALAVADAEIGDNILIQIADQQMSLRVAGTLHDINLSPAWQENKVYGYVSVETLTTLGIPPQLNELRITVVDKAEDEAHIRDVAQKTSAWLETQGYPVVRTEIPPPLEHPNQNQMESLMMLLAGFGVLVFLLSTALVGNMMAAFLSKQTRQIAVMKAIGARRGQIIRLYVGMVLILCALAAIALPIGVMAGRLTADFVAFILNFTIESYAIPHPIFLLQLVVGVVVPLLAASYPIYKGTHQSVREALNDYGLAQGEFGDSWFDRQLSRVRGLQRPLLLSLRNTFRQRGRLILTFSTLAIGGALFMAALNVRASLLNTIDGKYEAVHYDVTLNFNKPYARENLEAVALATDGVAGAEAWGRASAAIVNMDGTAGNIFTVLAPPADTALLNLKVTDGQWLSSDDKRGIVLNHNLLADYPDLRIGDEISLSMLAQEQTWRIIGIVREPASPPVAYMAYADFEVASGGPNQAQSLVVVTHRHDETSLIKAKQALEESFSANGFLISTNLNSYDSRKIVEDHAVLITSFLVMAAVLSLLVGGLGLMTTMSINVLERTREIGVMRAIGASNKALLKIILGEGIFIGVLSWLLATAIVIPVSYLVAQMLGKTLLETHLDFTLDPFGFLVWLGVVVVFSTMASLPPAWNAIRLPVRNVLAYE